MRKMFSENQIKGLAVQGVNEGIEQGQVEVGTKLFLHVLDTGTDNLQIITNSPVSPKIEEGVTLTLFSSYENGSGHILSMSYYDDVNTITYNVMELSAPSIDGVEILISGEENPIAFTSDWSDYDVEVVKL